MKTLADAISDYVNSSLGGIDRPKFHGQILEVVMPQNAGIPYNTTTKKSKSAIRSGVVLVFNAEQFADGDRRWLEWQYYGLRVFEVV